jgi:hypothetical protein
METPLTYVLNNRFIENSVFSLVLWPFGTQLRNEIFLYQTHTLFLAKNSSFFKQFDSHS